MLGVVFWDSLPVQALLSRGQIFLVAAFSLMLLVGLVVVHRKARLRRGGPKVERAALASSCGGQPGVTRQ